MVIVPDGTRTWYMRGTVIRADKVNEARASTEMVKLGFRCRALYKAQSEEGTGRERRHCRRWGAMYRNLLKGASAFKRCTADPKQLQIHHTEGPRFHLAMIVRFS